MWTTIGHAWAIDFVQQAMRRQRVAHAYLITGPSRVGKTHLAKELAAALNCRAPAVQDAAPGPCGKCSSCRRIAEGSHPDVSMIAPEGGREGVGGHIRIDQVRRLQHELSLSPYEGPWRVCIVSDFQTATREASNALLKTLEEPPAHVVLVLTATDASYLLPTIISRCQVLSLRAAPTAEIAQALVTRYGVNQERAQLVADVAGGRVGWAVQAVQDDTVWQEREQRFEDLWRLLQGSSADRIAAAEELAKDDDLRGLAHFWQAWWRDVLLFKADCGHLVAHHDQFQRIEAVGDCTMEHIHKLVRDIEQLLVQMEHNVNLRLALEVLLLDWPRTGRTASVGMTSS